MNTKPLSDEQVADFLRDGFIVVSQLLDAEEAKMLQQAARADTLMQQNAMHVEDTEGRTTNLSLWNHPGDDIFGTIARSHRIVDAMEQLLGGEVYHYHSKLSAKQPKVGGAWEWHQDYGYWYLNGCLTPDMASAFIAIDRSTKENGCLQVLVGSHHMGRIEHGIEGGQTGADPKRVTAAKERYAHRYVELEPGDGLIFHSNLLHSSDPNLSDDPRWTLICCYNAASNDPYEESHHPRYTPLEKLPDSAIKEIGAKPSSAAQEFLHQEDDQTTG